MPNGFMPKIVLDNQQKQAIIHACEMCMRTHANDAETMRQFVRSNSADNHGFMTNEAAKGLEAEHIRLRAEAESIMLMVENADDIVLTSDD